MQNITAEEKQLKYFMLISGLTYLFVGWFFLLRPELTLKLMHWASGVLTLNLDKIPIGKGKFWLSMTFSMMMTISVLSFLAFYNVRRNKGYVVMVLISKSMSALSALGLFFFSLRYFAYIGIFLVDGSIFWVTLIFFLRANKAFLRAQTFYLHDKTTVPKVTPPTTVVSLSGEDKLALLDNVLEQSGFYSVLDSKFQSSGKQKKDFKVVLKPNFMFCHHIKDISTYTDPELVEALVDRIYEKGFTNITLVEAQSTLGNYYTNREVVTVAKYLGYSTEKNYRIVDLTEEMVPYDYGGRLGKHFVGPTWRDADFRASFAKNKTHVFCHYTLTLKNIYGTLPMQNKLKEYHTKREYDWPTIESLKHFPVQFGLIDAIYSADGQFGVIVDPDPNHTKTIIGGENLIAVDWVGAKKMGLDPDDPQVGRYLPLAVEAFGKPEEINWLGDKSLYKPWENVSEALIKSLDILEEAYVFSDKMFSGLNAMDGYFKFKKKALYIKIFRKILAPIKRLLYTHDELH
jgi:uncharacterized protein (DUF362 family)